MLLTVIRSKRLIDVLINGILVEWAFNGVILTVELSIVAASVSVLCVGAVLWRFGINVLVEDLVIVTSPSLVVTLSSCCSPNIKIDMIKSYGDNKESV